MGHKTIQKPNFSSLFVIFFYGKRYMPGRFFFFSFLLILLLGMFILHLYLGQKTAGEGAFASPVGPRHT